MIRKILRYVAFVVLFTVVCLSAEVNSRNRRCAELQEVENAVLAAQNDPFDMRMAVEANSNFVVVPLVARVSGAVVRTISARIQSVNDSLSEEYRHNVNRSTHHLKAVNEARLLRLSPLRIRTRYIYSLRRLVI